jgi:Ca2+-binding EF-hand superfamily protein
VRLINLKFNLLVKINHLLTLMSSNFSIKKYILCSLCVGLGFSFNLLAGEKNLLVVSQKVNTKVADAADPQIDGMQKTLELNFSPENREKLRKALDDYARSIDQDHEQIEARRRAMQQSIEERFFDADRDLNNMIDRQEATEKLPQIARHFNMVDQNQDGLISLDELEAAQMRILERRKAAEANEEIQKLLEADSAPANKRKSKQASNNSRKPSL